MPICGSIGCILEHLSHHLTADSRVRAALYFDERWYGILVDEEVIDRPPTATAFFVRDAGFPLNELPPTGVLAIDLCARE
jgi:hypothetical protein